MNKFYFGVIAFIIILSLLIVFILKWRKATNEFNKQNCYSELTDLIKRYILLAKELNEGLEILFKNKNHPDNTALDNLHQEFVETDFLLRGSIKKAEYMASSRILDLINRFLIDIRSSDVTTTDLQPFLKTATQKAEEIFRRMREELITK